MKRLQIILGIIMGTILAAAIPLSALAAEPQPTPDVTKPAWQGALAIVAPRSVPVGEEMSLGVFERHNQEPVPGAGVWALTKDAAEALKSELGAQNDNNPTKDYEAAINARGGFLGRTGNDGRLKHTFTEAGAYILVTFKPGYTPDYAGLRAGGGVQALTIKAPKRAEVGESFAISVQESDNGDAVKDAGVWAITRENAEALQTKLKELKASNQTLTDVDWDSLLKSLHTIFLGTTNGSGDLKYSFEKEGSYLLLAVKKGYVPGRGVIVVGKELNALAVETPGKVQVGDSATIRVTERDSQDAVKDAGVWALSRENAEALKAKVEEIRKSGRADLQSTDWESVLKGLNAEFLGFTNGNGQVKHTFNEAGGYIIVALKPGYVPGYGRLAVVAPQVEKPQSERPNTQKRNTPPPPNSNNK